jgi:hypothetical protein
VNTIGIALMFPAVNHFAIYASPVVATAFRATLMRSETASAIVVSISKWICRYRRLDTDHAIRIADWLSKLPPGHEIEEVVNATKMDVIGNPGGGSLLGMLHYAVTGLQAAVVCTVITIGRHYLSQWYGW